MTRLRLIIAEDEPLARTLLRSLLEQRGDVEIAAEVGDGLAAVEAIERLSPDVALLDVEMPVLDGFGVVEAVGPERMPPVIFVTAFNQYAIRAFDIQAFDYLLKPFDRGRLDRAIDRVREDILGAVRVDDLERRLIALLAQLRPEMSGLRRIAVRTEHGFRFVDVDDIEWIEADGKVVRLHVGKQAYSVRRALGALEARLDPDRFVRVHRSAIVNVRCIKEVQPWFQGEWVVVLSDGSRVSTGRRHRARVRQLLGLPEETE